MAMHMKPAFLKFPLYICLQSSMVLSDKMGRAHELYQLYNQYPEDLLFEVFNNMKNVGIITKVKKVLLHL